MRHLASRQRRREGLWPVLDLDGARPVTSGRPLGGGAAPPTQLRQAKAVAGYRDPELTDVQTAAAKWQTGLVGIAGGITLFSIVKSRTDIAGLKQPFPALTGILLALGLALSVAGT